MEPWLTDGPQGQPIRPCSKFAASLRNALNYQWGGASCKTSPKRAKKFTQRASNSPAQEPLTVRLQNKRQRFASIYFGSGLRFRSFNSSLAGPFIWYILGWKNV